MKHMRSHSMAAVALVAGLVLVGSTQGQTKLATTEAVASIDGKSEICVYDISGKDGLPGMTCGGCTYRVKTALLDVEGIQSVDAVDLASGTATVTIAKESTAKEDIPEIIADAGFVATLRVDEEPTEE
ncbi:MAG: heavy-metal-associated domain-containing protein [Candidatus Neomarinimicrobiota bacterium]